MKRAEFTVISVIGRENEAETRKITSVCACGWVEWVGGNAVIGSADVSPNRWHGREANKHKLYRRNNQ